MCLHKIFKRPKLFLLFSLINNRFYIKTKRITFADYYEILSYFNPTADF